MAQIANQDSLRDRATQYRLAGERAHAEGRFRFRNRMFKLHDNVMMRIFRCQSGSIPPKDASSKR